MRRAYNKTDFIVVDGKLTGLSLGYDFCAEHEWGVKSLREAFGVGKKSTMGVDSALMTIVPAGLGFLTNKDEATLYYLQPSSWRPESDEERLKQHEGDLRSYSEKQTIVAAWDEREFAVRVKGADNIAFLKEVYDHFKNNDICFGMMPDAWTGSGLCFVFYSELSDEFKEEVMENHKEAARMESMVEKSGIREKLKAANKRYYALCEPRIGKDGKLGMWLNPCDQQENNYGWFSIEELEQWCSNEGPIPKKSGE